ncbi:Aste57867_6524 [Aphanomyces stellatus]|uniref:Aste57867_6524 protein n=1 Tax=Aphanomyces stellatus TaxID=120398 RepID=A0A485KH97_9STRA|nr:hypothetical protein As57867_006507 [Aphanomyces stellatus]VFT83506.1 Aste57867_6524 [Aphanomyces stellatus]
MVADARRAVIVHGHFGILERAAGVERSDGCECSTEAVARKDPWLVSVGGQCRVQLVADAAVGFPKASVEPNVGTFGVGGTSDPMRRGHGINFEIRENVSRCDCAAKSHNKAVVDVIEEDSAVCVGCEIEKRVQHAHVVSIERNDVSSSSPCVTVVVEERGGTVRVVGKVVERTCRFNAEDGLVACRRRR